MKFLVVLAASTGLFGEALGQYCGGKHSRACVSLWAKPNSGNPLVNAWVPNCRRDCHNQGFESLILSGKPIAYGPLWKTTRCHVYDQPHCRGNKIKDTGNVKSPKTINTPGAKSLQCDMGC